MLARLRFTDVLFMTLALPACSGSTRTVPESEPALPVLAPGKRAPNVAADCAPFAQVMDGPFRYVNDQWGSAKARGDFEQCLLTRTLDGKHERGWTWNWPGLDLTVFAYPSVTFGWKPWVGGESTDRRLPLEVGNVARLSLDYAVETDAEGSFNLAPEIWFIGSTASAEGPQPALITREIMFWMEYGGDATPAGRAVESVTLGGTLYELWKEENIGKEANGVGWTLFTFKSPTLQREGTVPMHEALAYLVEKGLLRDDEYVASVEFGNEVMGGSGTTWVKRLEVDVAALDSP